MRTQMAGLREAVARERAQHARLRAVDIESWYTELKDHTFHTVFVALARPVQSMIPDFAYKALHHTELHIKHYRIRSICRSSIFFSAVYIYAKILYNLVLYMQIKLM